MRWILRVLVLTLWMTAATPQGVLARSLDENLSTVLAGIVQNNSGQAVVDAEVRCWWFLEGYHGEITVLEPKSAARTGNDGSFYLMCDFPLGESLTFEGVVAIRHAGYGIALTHWQRTNARIYQNASELSDVPRDLLPAIAEHVITLPDRARIAGTVRDTAGTPVAGALITASVTIPFQPSQGGDDPGSPPIPQRTDSILSTTSGSDGGYVLDGLPAGIAIAIHAWHAESGATSLGDNQRLPGELPFSYIPDSKPLDIILPGAGSLRGAIEISQTDTTLPADAKVRATSLTDGHLPPRDVPVDPTGNYTIPALAPGNYRLELFPPPLYSTAALVTIASATATKAPPLYAGPGAVLAGAFVHPETGAAMGDAKVRLSLSYSDGDRVSIDSTLGDGTFRITARPGVVSLYATGLNGDVDADAGEKKLVLKHGTRNESLQFPFTRYRAVSGRVLLPSGEAAAGASVALNNEFHATTDDSGAFLLSLPAHAFDGNPKTFAATYESDTHFMGATTLPQEAFLGMDVTITVKEPASVKGVLVDLDNVPVTDYPATLVQSGILTVTPITDLVGAFVHRQLFPDTPVLLVAGLSIKKTIDSLQGGELRDIGTVRVDRTELAPQGPADLVVYQVSDRMERP